MSVWLLNGVPTESLPIDDRGFQYGDGLFETIAVREGKPRFLDAHLRRLEAGLARLELPLTPVAAARAEIEHVASGCGFGIVKAIVTRGSGPRGYRPPVNPEPLRMVGLLSSVVAPAHCYSPGIVLRVCRTRISSNPAIAGIKTLGRLEQVLARAEWSDPEIMEGLMLDEQHHVISGTMTNFFYHRGERLCTPTLTRSGIAGIMRGIVLDQAASMGLDILETEICRADLQEVDGMFVTNSQIGIWPVRRLGDRPVATGTVTRELMRRLVDVGVAECAT